MAIWLHAISAQAFTITTPTFFDGLGASVEDFDTFVPLSSLNPTVITGIDDILGLDNLNLTIVDPIGDLEMVLAGAAATNAGSTPANIAVSADPTTPAGVMIDFAGTVHSFGLFLAGNAGESPAPLFEALRADDTVIESASFVAAGTDKGFDFGFFGIASAEAIAKARVTWNAGTAGIDHLVWSAAVPEPSPALLAVFGLLGLALFARTSRRGETRRVHRNRPS